jgi:hypothetical protein
MTSVQDPSQSSPRSWEGPILLKASELSLLRRSPQARADNITQRHVDGPEGTAISTGFGVLVATVASLPLAWVGLFSAWFAATAFILATLLSLRLLRCRLAAGWDAWTVATLTALSGILILNIIFFGEHVEADRDPGLYWYKAMHLSETGSLFVPSNEGPFADSDIVLERTGGGFDNIPGTSSSYVQFLSAPAIFAATFVPTFGWSGPMVASAFQLFLAAFALALVVRRATAPEWGFVAALASATSLPWIYFGRLSYSEPLSAALIATGFAALASGAIDRAPARFIAGATLLGSAAVARVDAGVAVSGAVVATALIGRWQGFGKKHLTTAILVTSLGSIVAVCDLKLASPVYLTALREQITLVILLYVFTLSAALAIGLIDFTAFRRFTLATTLYSAAIGFVVCWAFLWFLGPHVLELRGTGPAYSQAVLQAREGLAEDVGRTYGERLPQRLAISVGVLVPGLALLALLGSRTKPRPMLTAGGPLLAAGLATTAVYSVRASITPDMVWALRRLIPVIIPAFVFLAVSALAGLALNRKAKALAACVVLVSVVSTSAPVVFEKERNGTLGALQRLCARMPENAAALFLAGPLDRFARPAEASCRMPVAVGVAEPGIEDLRRLRYEWEEQGRSLVVIASMPLFEIGPSLLAQSTPITWIDRRLERTIVRAPERFRERERTFYIYSLDG